MFGATKLLEIRNSCESGTTDESKFFESMTEQGDLKPDGVPRLRGIEYTLEGFDPGSERTLAAWIRHASRGNAQQWVEPA